jgi:hypothetical protein
MFERNPVDARSGRVLAIDVELADGTSISGRSPLAASKGPHQLLSGDDAFLFIECFDGESTFISKADIKALTIVNGAPARRLAVETGADAADLDPYRVLGLKRGASWAEVRDAYHRLAKLYHPDRFAGVELPTEVATYIEGMAKQINVAFRLLRSAHRAQPPRR